MSRAETSSVVGAPGAQILPAAAPDGQRFATSSDDDKAVRLWDPSGKLVWERTGLTSWVGGLAYAQDGKVIVTGQGSSVGLLNAADGSLIAEIPLRAYIRGVAVSPDGRFVAAAQADAVYLIDVELRRFIAKLASPVGGDPWFTDVAFHPDGRHFAATNQTEATLIGSVTEMRFVAKSAPPKADPDRVVVAPDGMRAYVGRYDGTIQVLDLSPLR